MAKKTKPPKSEAANPPLKLVWIEAGQLGDNPQNWRRHPDQQVAALKDLIADPEIGWAGACLFNERTGRLIDGHARKNSVDPAIRVPVLVGSWSEEAERKILLTLDPLASLAVADDAKVAELMEAVNFNSDALGDLLASMQPAQAVDQSVDGTPDARAKTEDPAGNVNVRAVFSVADANEIERAIMLTGNVNRGQALAEICRSYAKGQQHAQEKGGAAA